MDAAPPTAARPTQAAAALLAQPKLKPAPQIARHRPTVSATVDLDAEEQKNKKFNHTELQTESGGGRGHLYVGAVMGSVPTILTDQHGKPGQRRDTGTQGRKTGIPPPRRSSVAQVLRKTILRGVAGADASGDTPRMVTLYGQFPEKDLWTKERLENMEAHWSRTSTFTLVMCIIILANAFVLGLEVDHPTQYPTFFYYAEVTFCTIYFFEMSVKVNNERWKYFEDWIDQFDYLVVASTTAAVIYQLVAGDESGSDAGAVAKVMSFLRVARLMRLVKIVRLTNQFKVLNFLSEGLARARGTIFYVTLILFFPYFYFFANTLTNLIPLDHPALDRRKYFGADAHRIPDLEVLICDAIDR
jgi:hypothetical protein